MSIKDAPEYEYSKQINIEHRKEFAQFFTPEPIAALMAGWLLGNSRMKTVLEPAFGLGVFSRALLDKKADLCIKGYDIDETIMSTAVSLFEDKPQVSIIKNDYIRSSWSELYDGIICNPPYFKFHDYDNLGAIKEVKSHLGLDCSGFTNLYALFLIKSVSQLKKRGRCAYIIPSEFMNSDYGVQIKDYLLRSGRLRHIIVFNFEENLFDDAITTSAIVLCANDDNDQTVSFTNICNADELGRIEQLISSYPNTIQDSFVYNTTKLKSSNKWKQYYQNCNQSKFDNLVPFSTFAKVSRGIATGANDFFKFNEQKAREFNIPRQNLKPCICHCVDVPGSFFDQTDFKALSQKGKYVYIFDGVGSKNPSVLKYVEKGEAEKQNEKFLTKSRTPWYALEKREPAPIWVSVFSRDRLHFVRNTSNATCLTTFHCVYPESDVFGGLSIDLLFAYLLTDTARQIFLDNGREYGNGLSKFEPNDLNKGMMLDLRLLSDDDKHEIEKSYKRIQSGDDSAIIAIDNVLRRFFAH